MAELGVGNTRRTSNEERTAWKKRTSRHGNRERRSASEWEGNTLKGAICNWVNSVNICASENNSGYLSGLVYYTKAGK